MSQILSPAAARPAPASSGYRVDPGRGSRDGRVSSEWFSRPTDERFLSLSDLQRSVDPDPRPLPEPEAAELALGAMIDALSGLLIGTRLEDEVPDLLWSLVNLLRR
ncbi:hypothetical protein [Lichenibacterium minor]|uniref:hypothetical protein n=1 Tax=Lichenibacterium minor TaxID=2316528 RepID=UPI0026D5EA76